MYNRYIPQPDGSYRRSHQPDQAPSRPPQQNRPNRPSPAPGKPQDPPRKEDPPQAPSCHRPVQQPQGQSILQFFRQLLPRDFDTADLIIVLLLLLMAGNDQEEQNHALLTLALYLFL